MKMSRKLLVAALGTYISSHAFAYELSFTVGGTGGGAFNDANAGINLDDKNWRVEKVIARSGNRVDAIETCWFNTQTNQKKCSGRHGGGGGNENVLWVNGQGDWIKGVSAYAAGNDGNGPEVTGMAIAGQNRTVYLGGGEVGGRGNMVKNGYEAIGFYGRSGSRLDQIGTIIRKR